MKTHFLQEIKKIKYNVAISENCQLRNKWLKTMFVGNQFPAQCTEFVVFVTVKRGDFDYLIT